MMMLLEWWVVMPLLGVSTLMALIRLAIGPSLADRVVAFDMFMLLALAFISTFAIIHNEPLFLDVGVLLALVAFIATVAFARYLEKRVE